MRRRIVPPLGPPRLPPARKGEPWRDVHGRYTWSPGASPEEKNRARLRAARDELAGAPHVHDEPGEHDERRSPQRRPFRADVARDRVVAERPPVDVEAKQAVADDIVKRVIAPAGVDKALWRVRSTMTDPYIEVSQPGSDRKLGIHRVGEGFFWEEHVDEPDRYGVMQTVSRGGGYSADEARVSAVVRDFVSAGGARSAGERYVREDDVIALLRQWGYLPQNRATVELDAARSLLDAFDDVLSDEEQAAVWALEAFERVLHSGYARARARRATALVGAALAEFNSKHPRGPGGKFRTVAARLMHALAEWQAKGDRNADPFEGFSREQLRKVAKARGVSVRRGADRDEISKALLDHLERREMQPRGEGVDSRAHRTMVTLASGEKATIEPDQVDALMRATTAMASAAKRDAREGETPPTFNLGNLQISGPGNENLFRRHLRDRPRETMPQLPTGFGEEGKTAGGRTMEEFEEYLRSQGVEFEYGEMDPRELVASQSELSGPKVAKLYGFMRDGGWLPTGVMIIARSGDEWAVVDGHHRWAGAAAASIARGGTLQVRVLKIDAELDDVLGTPENPEGIVMGFASFEGLATDREA